MSDVIDRPVLEQEASAKSRLADHRLRYSSEPACAQPTSIRSCPSAGRSIMKTYGDHLRTPYIGTTPYPRSSPLIARRDAWPPTGGPPGSDLAFMRKQHLDPLDIEFGILQVLDLFIFSQQNLDFGAAIQRAINEWQLAHWTSREPRLKAVDPGRAGRHRGRDRRDRALRENRPVCADQCLARAPTSRSADAVTGRSMRAREELGLPLGIHVGGYGGHAPTGGGWPSYYAEEHQSNAHSVAAQLTSLVIEGVPERFPRLKIVFIEGGFGWIASTMWRMDQHFERFRERGPAPQAPSVRICDGAFLVHDPADRRTRRGEASAIPDRTGSAWTVCCSRRIIRIGISTTRALPSRRR